MSLFFARDVASRHLMVNLQKLTRKPRIVTRPAGPEGDAHVES